MGLNHTTWVKSVMAFNSAHGLSCFTYSAGCSHPGLLLFLLVTDLWPMLPQGTCTGSLLGFQCSSVDTWKSAFLTTVKCFFSSIFSEKPNWSTYSKLKLVLTTCSLFYFFCINYQITKSLKFMTSHHLNVSYRRAVPNQGLSAVYAVTTTLDVAPQVLNILIFKKLNLILFKFN